MRQKGSAQSQPRLCLLCCGHCQMSVSALVAFFSNQSGIFRAYMISPNKATGLFSLSQQQLRLSGIRSIGPKLLCYRLFDCSYTGKTVLTFTWLPQRQTVGQWVLPVGMLRGKESLFHCYSFAGLSLTLLKVSCWGLKMRVFTFIWGGFSRVLFALPKKTEKQKTRKKRAEVNPRESLKQSYTSMDKRCHT